MVAWWPLDESSGTIAEELVNGNDGALANGPTPITGRVAGAYQFDGVNDYISVPDGPTLNIGAAASNGAGDLSIDAWIRTSSTVGMQVIVDKRTFTPTRGYSFFVRDGKLGFQIADGAGPGDSCGSSSADPCRTYDSGIVVATGNWVHVAVTVDRGSPSGVRFYVDGVPTGSTFDPTTKPGALANSAPLSIARRSDALAHFTGSIDEVAIFNRALSANEVALIPNVGSNGRCKCLPRPDGLVSWWPADDCLAKDRVGPNDGTFIGLPTCPSDPKVGGGAWALGPTYIRVASHPSLAFGLRDFSIDGWIKTSNLDAPIVQKGIAGRLFSLGVVGGKLRFDACDDQVCSTVESAAGVATGDWRFVGVTFERIGEVSPGYTNVLVTLYVDGLPDGTAGWVLGHVDSLDDLLIGAGGVGPNSFFNGRIDELEIFRRAISASEMRALHDVDRYGKCKCEEPPPNMIAWWPFDETVGPIARDIVAGHDGSYGGNPVPVAGFIGKALHFNGGTDKVTVPHAPGLVFGTGDLTIDFWVYNQGGLADFHNSFIEKPAPSGFAPGMWGVRYEGSGGAHLHVESTAPFLGVVIPPDVWKHVAITFEQGVPGTIKGYLDGILKATRTPPGPGVYNMSTTTPITIGNSTSGWGPPGLKARLDELELYNRALSQDEILGLVRAGACGKCKTTRIPRTTDIRIQKTVDNPNPIAGSMVTFQVLVANDGTDAVRSVIVRDLLPPGLVPVGHTLSGVGTYNPYSGQLILPSLAGQSAIVLTVVAHLETCNVLANCASFIGADATDVNPSNNVSCANVTPQSPCAEIHGTKFRDDNHNGARDPGEPPLQGQTMRLTGANGQVTTAVSGSLGEFAFLPLGPGTWKLSEIVAPDQVLTSPPGGSESIVLSARGQSFGHDVGNYQCAAAPPPPCAEPPRDLAEWWPLDSIQSGPAGCAYTSGIVRNVRDRVFGSPVGAANCGVATSPGRRGSAIAFDGIDDYVEAQNHPALNFGPASFGTTDGDFSIDAWIKTASAGLQIIVDKRREDTPGGVQGYSLFMFSGRLWLQLASANGVSNYDSGVTVNDAQWHHVTVTVDRDSTSGVQFYVDAVPAGLPGDPTPQMGTLVNPMPPRIGRRSDSATPGSFTGSIDEVEIFRRVLSLQEIQAIYDPGKCERGVPHVAPYVPICLGRASVATPITLCNWTGLTQTIRWSLAGLGTSAGCSVNGPTSFSPVAGATPPLDPGACQTVMVTIARPLNLGAGDTSCFQLTAVRDSFGWCTQTTGTLVGDPNYCVPIDRYSDFVAIPEGTVQPVDLNVTNEGANETLDYRLRVAPGDSGTVADEVVALGGLPPGAPMVGTLALPPGGTATLSVPVEYLQSDSLRFRDLLLEADSDGGGVFTPIASLGMRSTSEGAVPPPCSALAPDQIDLRFSSSSRLTWTAPGCAAVYNVYRHVGPLTDADGDRVADDYGRCYETGLTVAESFDTSFPAASSYHSYLVTGVNASGESALGNASAGPRRIVESCP